MSVNKSNATFQYTYSAKEQEEVKRIRSKYVPREESKLERLRRMDAQVTQKAAVRSISVGVIGTLIFGGGMSCCMAGSGDMFLWGILLGVIGMAAAGAAYPVYTGTLKKERDKAAPEILRLTEELMK